MSKFLKSLLFCLLTLSATHINASDAELQADIEKLNKILRTTQTLNEIHKRKINRKELVESYRKSSDQWKNFYFFQDQGLDLYYDQLDETQRAKLCEKNIHCQEIKDLKEKVINKVELHFSLIAKNRINIIRHIILKNQLMNLNFNKDLLQDLFHEIKSVPLRWISKVSYQIDIFKSDIQKGYTGWIKILKQLFIFVFYILFGVALHKVSGVILKKLNEVKSFHARRAYRNKRSALITQSISLYSNYLPWIIQIIYFQYLEVAIRDSYFSELSSLIPLFINYAYYRIIKILIHKFFTSFTRGSFSLETKKKLDFTVNYLSILFLSISILLNLLKTAGGEGLVYFIIQKLFIYISIFNIFYIASKWDNELWKYIDNYLPKTGKFLSKLKLPILTFFIHPLLFLVITMHKLWNFIYERIERFDIVKTISAQIFRKQLDNKRSSRASNGESIRYDQYFNSFMYSDILEGNLNSNQKKAYDGITTHIDNLFQDKDFKPVHLIVGEKGIGKTTVLDLISEKYKDNSFVKYTNFSSRANIEKEINELKEICDSSTKKIIIINGLQFLFISKLGGFELFKSFLELLTQENSQNFIWCISVNNYSWEFIEAVLKKTRYFNCVYKIDKWTEEEISKLILQKNKSTQMTIKYDRLLSQAQIGLDDVSLDIQNKYFRLLWEEALGNPSKAKEIWLNSIEKMNDTTVYAYIPDEIEDKIETLPNEYYFILANIVRHESINLENIIQSTCLTEDIVRNALRTCIDIGLVEKSANQYSIDLLKQHVVYSTLRRMNFIYG